MDADIAPCSALNPKTKVAGCLLRVRTVFRTYLEADADPAPLAAADALDAQRLVTNQGVLAATQLLHRGLRHDAGSQPHLEAEVQLWYGWGCVNINAGLNLEVMRG